MQSPRPEQKQRRVWWRQLLRNSLAAVLPRRLYLTHGPARGGSVCLTFDDGPDPEQTPRVLDVLAAHGARATFFVLGRQVERYPDLVRRTIAEGHQVGHHSFSHSEPDETSARQLLDEIGRTAALLVPLAGQAPRLFRPPKGKVTAGKLWRLWWTGHTVVLWNADPKDYACSSAAEIGAWFRQRPLESGDVVLFHDTRPHAAAVLPGLIADARQRGLRFTTIGEWLS
jgi:peptidoglycan-N-acetylglucosamine deacetylase